MADELLSAMRRAIQKEPVYSIVGNVSKIDKVNGLCVVTPINGDADISEVRLVADISGKTFFIPKDGSVVVVSLFSETAGVIIGYSELEEINLNGVDKGGLVVVADLLQKINTLEKDLNTLKGIFTTWIPVPNDGGASLKSLSGQWYGQQITVTLQTDIENKTVKHGTSS